MLALCVATLCAIAGLSSLQKQLNSAAVADKLDELVRQLDKLEQADESQDDILDGFPVQDFNKKPSDCAEVKQYSRWSGMYTIWPATTRGVRVYCDLWSDASTAWIVVQRRQEKGRLISFNQTWNTYVKGFGDLNSEFWIGLDVLNYITKTVRLLRVETEDWNLLRYYAEYASFFVGDPNSLYRLGYTVFTDGTPATKAAGNGLRDKAGTPNHAYHKTRPFSTPDSDNDLSLSKHCAKLYGSGWWFSGPDDCYVSNLNGKSDRWGSETFYRTEGIIWTNLDYSLKGAEMKLRKAG